MARFEVFTKRLAPLGKTPGVTIQKRGAITLNASAYALLGKPKAVELLYDRDSEVVGMRAVDEVVQHSYTLRQQGAKANGPMVVAGTAFTQYYKIDTSVARRWIPTVEDGILCIDLKHGGVEVTSNRNRGKIDPTLQD
jgi:hypothetical protein